MRSDPLILAFDTSAAHCAAALLSGQRVLVAREEEGATGQAERLMPMLEEMLAEAGIRWGDLAALGVGVGPGNFTGVRISVAAARGLALALERPAIGVDGFAALGCGLPCPILAALDARRGQAYVRLLTAGGNDAPMRVAPDDLPGELRGTGLDVVGYMADVFATATGGSALEPRHPFAVAIGLCALERLGSPQPRPAPLYLRAADAAPPSEAPPVLLP